MSSLAPQVWLVNAILGLTSSLAPLASTAPSSQTSLRPTGPITADVSVARISADGTRVVYTADPESDDAFELFSVPILGGPSRRLNPRPVPGGDVAHYHISPDSRRVAWVGDLDSDQVFELYAASITGRPALKLSPPMVAGGDVSLFGNVDLSLGISPDSRFVVFLADAERDGVVELYSAPLAGGAAVKLSLPLTAAGSVRDFRIAPEGERVVYLAATESFPLELYCVPISGGASTKLSLPLEPGASVRPQRGFHVSSSKRVVYAVGSRLYSVPLTGGASVELADTQLPRGYFHIDPLGNSAYYLAPNDGFHTDLYSVPIAGGASTLLNPPSSERITFFEVSSDGTRIVCSIDNGDEVTSVFSVPSAGGAAAELAHSQGQVYGVELTADARRVLVSLDGLGDLEWHSVPMQGGPPSVLLKGLDSGGLGSPDSRWFVFVTPPPFRELARMPIEGGATLPLSPPLVAGGSVVRFLVSPDSTRVVYTADQDVDEVVELYSVSIDGGAPLRLSPEFLPAR